MAKPRVEALEDAAIDLRSDLMAPRPPQVAAALALAAQRAPAMNFLEDSQERALYEALAAELDVEAVLLVPTCTMANQIAIRLHLPDGGTIASAALAHVVTVEARATALTGVEALSVEAHDGHPTPDAVADFLRRPQARGRALVWLENTHMLSAGSVTPDGWQDEIARLCRGAACKLHLDGSRLWSAAVARRTPMSRLTEGCDTVSLSLNKAIGAPVGSVLVGSRATIEAAAAWREALGGEWRPIGAVAAAALAALDGWRERLEVDAAMTSILSDRIGRQLGPEAIRPSPTNLIFLNRPIGDARAFVEVLARLGVRTIAIRRDVVRLAIHSGVREREVAQVAAAVFAAHAELAAQ